MSKVVEAETIVKKMSNLVELEHDAMAAYKAAIERLDDPAFKSKLQEFLADHERHLTELSDVIRDAGGTPPDSGDIKKILTKGKVVLADLGGDDALLKAMKVNEDQTVQKYEAAIEEDYPDNIQSTLKAALSDERRHRTWMEETAKGLS